jgi:transcriptional regulator with XRE-family HTH domain
MKERDFCIPKLGKRIKEMREKRKLTQSQLAKKIGKNKSLVWRYENEPVRPDGNVLQKIAEILETRVDYLLGRTNDPEPHQTIEITNVPDLTNLSGLNEAALEAHIIAVLDELTGLLKVLKEIKLSKLGK